MRVFIQTVCVFAIAVGAGLLAFGSRLEPPINLRDPATFARSALTYEDRDWHVTASATSGVGTGLLILGTLGLVIPWVNRIACAQIGELGENSARTFTSMAIWLSIAVILTCGVFRLNGTGAAAMSVILILVTLICAAATVSTAIAYGWKPWIRTGGNRSETDRHQAP
jgi:hypothetical protein